MKLPCLHAFKGLASQRSPCRWGRDARERRMGTPWHRVRKRVGEDGVDLRISQVVDVPNLLVSALLPLDIFM